MFRARSKRHKAKPRSYVPCERRSETNADSKEASLGLKLPEVLSSVFLQKDALATTAASYSGASFDNFSTSSNAFLCCRGKRFVGVIGVSVFVL